MNRQILQTLASDWVRVAKNDIRKKVIDFMAEVDTTPHELAYVLAISDGELQQIIEGNGEITLTTFAKLLIATGNALEIKPIEETPIGNYDNIPNDMSLEHPIPHPSVLEHPIPRPNIFDGQRVSMPYSRATRTQQPTRGHFGRINTQMPTEGHFEHFGNDIDERVTRQPQPRDEHGRFAPVRHEVPTSPFASKSTDELVNIIRERLWDSEINLNTATKNDLVKFLDEKNRRINEYKRIKALEEDPKVNEFKNRIKRTFENNPHLREWAKNFIGGLDD